MKLYLCTVCKCKYQINPSMIEFLDLTHESGESLQASIVNCPECESMQIPEGLNPISFIVGENK